MTKQRCDTRHRQTEDDGKSEENKHENHCTRHVQNLLLGAARRRLLCRDFFSQCLLCRRLLGRSFLNGDLLGRSEGLVCPGFDFNGTTKWECGNANGRAGRTGAVKASDIGLVESGERVHVGQEAQGLGDVMNADSSLLQTLLEILHGLGGLTSDTAGDQDTVFDTELTRHNHPVASANDRGIRTEGFGCRSSSHATNVSCQNRQLTHRHFGSYSHNSLTKDLKGIRMAIDESKRQDLYLAATEKFGRKEADTLMTLLPTSVWEDVATKTDLELHSALLKIQFNEVHNDLRTEISGVRTELKGDVASLRGELKGDIASLRGEITSLRGELKGDIASLRGELKGDIADLRADLKGDIADLRGELKGDIADVRLEIAELRIEMHQMFRKNYVVMISAIFAINSLFFTATKYWG